MLTGGASCPPLTAIGPLSDPGFTCFSFLFQEYDDRHAKPALAGQSQVRFRWRRRLMLVFIVGVSGIFGIVGGGGGGLGICC